MSPLTAERDALIVAAAVAVCGCLATMGADVLCAWAAALRLSWGRGSALGSALLLGAAMLYASNAWLWYAMMTRGRLRFSAALVAWQSIGVVTGAISVRIVGDALSTIQWAGLCVVLIGAAMFGAGGALR